MRLLPLAAALACLSCYAEAEPGPGWRLLGEVRIPVIEPSGLCLDPAGRGLWTVSDESGLVHLLNFQGEILRTLAWVGDDLEGICADPRDGTLWVAAERDGQAVHLSLEGTELGRHNLPFLARRGNSGLEGIACGPDGLLSLLQEKDPGALHVFDPGSGHVETTPLAFARDYSDCCLDPQRGGLWVLSDESRSLTLLRAGQEPWTLELGLERLEGVAVDGERLWLVSDSRETLYELELD